MSDDEGFEPDPDEPGYSPEPVSGREPPPVVPDDSWTLGAARDWLRPRTEGGVECPCCHQFAKVYRRKINASMARTLIKLWREGDFSKRLYVFVPGIDPVRGGDVTKSEYWGLIEEEKGHRTDGSSRVGYWRLTRRGEDWVQGKITVPKYARVYNGVCLNTTGVAWSVHDALGSTFSYSDLMAGI